MQLTLHLIRGLPGGGKTTMAQLIGTLIPVTLLEADMFFTRANGEYVFDPYRANDAHAWCIGRTVQELNAGHSVVVANTFVRYQDLQLYAQLAADFRARLYIFEARGNFDSVHNVPAEVIDRMRAEWFPFRADDFDDYIRRMGYVDAAR